MVDHKGPSASERDRADERKPLGRSVESLGWLASSGVQPRKRKEISGAQQADACLLVRSLPLSRPAWLCPPAPPITGVSNSSLLALKAQLAEAQQEATAVREGRLDAEDLKRRRGGGGPGGLGLAGRNAGVAARDARDRLQLKTAGQQLDDSRAALERKAALYERLAAGEEPEDERQLELYEVDFAVKPIDTAALAAGSQGRGGGLLSDDMAAERARREWEAEARDNLAREGDAAAAREATVAAIEEAAAEAEEERAAAARARASRADAEARKRERLKAAFMKKQLAALKQQQQHKGGGRAAGVAKQQGEGG